MATEIISRAAAKAQGLRRFYTGLPCRHGHVCERYVRDGKCAECVGALAAVRSRRWSALNPEKVKAATERWRAAHPDQWRGSNRQSKVLHQKAYNEAQRQDYAQDPEKYRKAARAYYARNREKMVERATIQWRTRRAQANGSAGPHHTAAEAKAILIAQRYRCIYCGADLREKRHLDHIVPLARGGSNDKTNLQYLCGPCNLRKAARDPIEFAQELGLLL